MWSTGHKAPHWVVFSTPLLESSWNGMAHGYAGEGKWRGNWRLEWVASTLHTTSEHGVSGITTADAHTSAASSRLNWGPGRFKWTRPFRRNTKSGFCACAITLQTQSTLSFLGPNIVMCSLFSNTACVLPSMCQAKFDTHTEQQAKLWHMLE